MMVPDKVGKYELQAVIGQGGMGMVYKGYDRDIDRIVAIKVMHPYLAAQSAGSDLMRRFKQEARAAARCVHLNIVTVFDYGINEDSPYIVMEYVEGLDLHSFLKAEQVLPLRQSADIILQTLAALDYAHKCGVVHRDIKPANILLLESGLVKVADFGIAKLETSELTAPGDIIGTPIYMSPEARRGLPTDARTDLYAVGMVLLRLVSGKRPIQGGGGTPDLAAVPMPCELAAAEQVQFRELLATALAPHPEDRFGSAHEFTCQLKAILAPHAVYESSVQELASTIVKTKRWVTQQRAKQPITAAAPTSASNLSHYLTPQAADLLNDELASYLGPVSSRLILATAAKSRTLDELIEKLTKHIPSEVERKAFMRSVEHKGVRWLSMLAAAREGRSWPTRESADGQAKSTPGSSEQGIRRAEHSGAPGVSLEELATATDRLATYIGPLASYLVKRSAGKAVNLRHLYELLAVHIEDPVERKQFLSKQP
ncbi:serine/threonine protein kinase [Nitrococcus mobilis]|uniref:Serine/threonine protein kinase n=1 Tax=Nitrococcus mobilis Nb-231 TaxID=314278 RepID=A4BTK3_9GAMM|nr:serine/threonine-protein kinase [Nitrococcus mobilis]EAR20959.1 Serine/threonine protein kinase [Nitrococcus mobilis Nb-231]